MKRNRKKQFRHTVKYKTKTPTTTLNDVSYVAFKTIKCEWLEKTDRFLVELDCVLNTHHLTIKGIIDDYYLVDEGIKLVTPLNMRTLRYKQDYICNELSLTTQDAPNLYEVLKFYIHSVGDNLDANQPIKPLSIQFDTYIQDENMLTYMGNNRIGTV